jgi:hypothetical protein
MKWIQYTSVQRAAHHHPRVRLYNHYARETKRDQHKLTTLNKLTTNRDYNMQITSYSRFDKIQEKQDTQVAFSSPTKLLAPLQDTQADLYVSSKNIFTFPKLEVIFTFLSSSNVLRGLGSIISLFSRIPPIQIQWLSQDSFSTPRLLEYAWRPYSVSDHNDRQLNPLLIIVFSTPLSHFSLNSESFCIDLNRFGVALHCIALHWTPIRSIALCQASQARSNGRLKTLVESFSISTLTFARIEDQSSPNSSSKRARTLPRGLQSSRNDTGSSFQFESSYWRRISRPGRSPTLHDKNKTIRQDNNQPTFLYKTTSTDRVPEVQGLLFAPCTVGPYFYRTAHLSNRRPPAPAFYSSWWI